MTRYFAKWRGERAEILLGIMRLRIDDEAQTIAEEAWNRTAWSPPRS